LDGHPALAAARRARISGAEAGLLTMRLRAEADAVMVGVATAHIDEPALTVRTEDGALTPRQPRRVLLARTEQPSASLGMLHDGAGLVTLLLPDDAPPDPVVSAACQVLGYPVSGGLVAALSTLGAVGIVSLLVEAGPRLFSALYDEALIDELVVLHGGGMAGGDAPALYVGTASIGGAVLVSPLGVTETGRAGTDAVSVWRPRNEHACPA
jgi:diaminohydroxyphosphoribosylaminopyrimidine deaminase/5-amino-6-(5-phosphoribosylamino)uracil reductase